MSSSLAAMMCFGKVAAESFPPAAWLDPESTQDRVPMAKIHSLFFICKFAFVTGTDRVLNNIHSNSPRFVSLAIFYQSLANIDLSGSRATTSKVVQTARPVCSRPPATFLDAR